MVTRAIGVLVAMQHPARCMLVAKKPSRLAQGLPWVLAGFRRCAKKRLGGRLVEIDRVGQRPKFVF